MLLACDELRPYLRRELGWPLSELGRIRLRRGDLAGAEAVLLSAHGAGWDPQPGLALVHLARGDITAAASSIRSALEHPVRVPSKERPPNSDLQRTPLLEAQVEIEVAAGNLGQARAAADELKVVAARFHSKALFASAAAARGRVRLAEGAAAEAEQLFSEAVRRWSEVGAPYEVAVARLGLAAALRAGGSERAAAMEHQAARTILDRIEAMPQLDSPGQVVGHDGRGQPSAGAHTVFRREGDYWLVVFDDHTARVPNLKGTRYLARLLAAPGRELLVLDLVAAKAGSSAPIDLGDAGELLDAPAKAAYRRRLVEIDEDIEDARASENIEREAQADAERDFVLRELARAVGLGGRDRRAGSASERARVSVTRAIRQAIARISDQHPRLGEHLDHAIHTGTYCAYQPDPRTPTRWNH